MIRESVTLHLMAFFIKEFFTVDTYMINVTIFPHFLRAQLYTMYVNHYYITYTMSQCFHIVITLTINICPTFLTTVSE